jgi:phage terminase large subunit GpA-like protein
MEDYDGADAIERAWRDGLTPDPLLTVSEWADRHRVLSQRASSEPGRWRTERTPYLKEIMDCLSPSSPYQRVVLMKGSQVGGSECGNNWIAYVIHQAPGPMMAVAPTVELAKRNSKQRIDPLIEESDVLRERVKERRSRDSGNTVLSKEFPGGVLILTGANSAVGLRSMPARYLFLDEVDGYPGDVEGEGDPILLAERRSATFQRRKILLVSTPKTKGLSRIEREYGQSDQRRYFVPCPHCNEHQTLELANLRWPESRPREAEYACGHCGSLIGERHKTRMLEHGSWRATAEGDGRTAGFHLSSLYSPVGWFSWADAAEMYEQAKKTPALMKGFVDTVLGLPFEEEAEAPEWQRLYERRENYRIGLVPEGGLFVTAGVDVQKDRIEVEVVAWGRGKESWSVDYRVIEGDTARAEVWAKLDAVVARDWPHAGGRRRGLRVWSVGTPVAKGELYRWLKLEWPTEEALAEGASYPPGACHFPQYGEEYFRQLTAERLVTRIVKGFPRGSWEKEPGRRDEALDCRVYARAAAAIFGLDRFEEKHWRRMEEALAVVADEERDASGPNRSTPVRASARRVIYSGYMAR